MLLTHWLRNLRCRLQRPGRRVLRRRLGHGWQAPGGPVPGIESLEVRQMLSGIVVTNTSDSGAGSLRQAILDSNASVGVRDTITFNIPKTDPGYNPATDAFVIKPSVTAGTGVALPVVTDAVTIDGYSQPGAIANTLAAGNNAVLKIEVNGTSTNPAGAVFGMEITAGDCLVRGLVIDGFTGPQLTVATNGGNVIQGNYIGTNITGSAGTPGGPWGIYVASAGNTIGSQGVAGDFAERNVIFAGIRIASPYAWSGAVLLNGNNNIVAGNYIGTDKTSEHALGSSGVIYQGTGSGVYVAGNYNRIGSDGSGAADVEERNVISGQLQGAGVFMLGTQNVVAGDYIGTDATGTVAVPNGAGIQNWGGTGNMIGTNSVGVPNASTRNVISGNSGLGISITIGGANYIVKGNYIGTDPTGTVAVPNGAWGIAEGMNGGSNETFGGPTAAERNLISGNLGGGIISWGPHDVFQGNYVGVDVTGTVPLGNKGVGMRISGTGDLVGGTAPGQGNLVSGNTAGIQIYGTNITVQGNYIGTDKTGTVKIGNGPPGGIYGYPANYYGGGVGIIVNTGSSNILIGGTTPGAGNVVSGNNDTGIVIGGNSANPAGPTGVVVQGNYIGTDATGTAPLGNGGYGGVLVWDYAENNLIGGTAPGAGNVISANANTNIDLMGTSPYHFGANGNVVEGNFIGTDKTGTRLVGSTPYDVQIFGTYGNTIGGSAPGAANVIGGATIAGVEVRASTLLPGLFGWFRGDDNNNDVNGLNGFNGNDVATLVNGATYAPGVSGQAFQLNGANQYAEFGSSNVYDQTYPLSLDAWVKPNSLSPAGSSQTIFSKYDSTDTVNQGESWLLQEADGGRIKFKVSQTLDGSISRTVETDNPVLTTGQWQHVAAVFDQTNQSMTIYVNGVAVPSTVQAGSSNVAYIALSNTPVRIGKSFDGVSNSFNGELDELGVFIGNPLTASQVQSIYASHGQGQGGGNFVQGNFIGTDVTGTLNLGNPGDGVRIEWYNNYGNVTSPSNTTIGGTDPGAGNTIANNGGNGVVLRTDYLNPYNSLIHIDTGTGNAILGNSIYDNHKIGIDLVGGTEDANGITSNHTGFTRGPNYLQNHPLVASAVVANGTVTFHGTLNSTPDATYRIEFFANPSSATGTEEGQIYLGSTSVTTDGSGNAVISAQLTATIPAGFSYVTATATDSAGNTSEFSTPIQSTLAETPLIAGALTAPVATEGQVLSNVVVFHFTDADPAAMAGDNTATVFTGDATLTSTANPGNVQIVANPNGGYDVQLSYTYAAELADSTFSVQVTDADGAMISASDTTFSVADAALTGSTGRSATGGVEGVTAATLANATFTDANLGAPSTDFTVTAANWGDTSTATAGLTVTGSNGSYTINGSHLYAAEGSKNFSITVTDDGGQTATITGTTTVSDAALSAISVNVSATEGARFTGAVATFTDANPGDNSAEMSATIDWGNGTSSGFISYDPGSGMYTVTGSNTYPEEGSHPVSVTIMDAGGSTVVSAATLPAGAISFYPMDSSTVDSMGRNNPTATSGISLVAAQTGNGALFSWV